MVSYLRGGTVKGKFISSAIAAGAFVSASAAAAPLATASPVGGQRLPADTEVGSVVLDAIGANGTRVTSQLAAGSLFVGNTPGPNLTIGTHPG